MQRHLQPAVDRFKALTDDELRTAFRDKLSGYVKLYAFLSQIIPYADRELEMLSRFGRFLLQHLQLDRGTPVVQVAMRWRSSTMAGAGLLGAIEIRDGEPAYVKSPTEVGTGRAQDEKRRCRRSSKS